MALAAILALTGCEAKPEAHSREIFAMNTVMSLTAYGENAAEALDSAVDRINTLERSLSVTLPDSDICRLNSAAGKPVSVGEDALHTIKRALEISEKTEGALDITIYPVLKEWGFTTGEYSVPTAEKLALLLEYVDYSMIELNGGSVTIPEGFSVDLGAVAKGYASECAADILKSAGVTSGILNLGGNVCAIGSKPDGSPWKVAVASPFEGEDYAGILTAENKFVVTSGKYERYFTGEDGRNYHHIIDPKTGYPTENGLAAVTIIGVSGTQCDALSTALLVMGEDRAREYWQENSGFDMLLVTDDRRLVITPGISQDFKPSAGFTTEVIQ